MEDKARALTPAESERLSLEDPWVREAENFRLGVLTGRGTLYEPPYIESPEGLKLIVVRV
jgi:hypothetical protein